MDTRQHVERAYAAALAVVERSDLQHLNPYQLAGHIHRARQAHLADLASDPLAGTQHEHVAHDALAAVEDHPEAPVIDWAERGRAAAIAGAERTLPAELEHPRSKPAREFFAGYDEAKAAASAG